ncbi:MAG: glycoside hydrolase family 2 TIM barrel-domain containing protein [Candidatus Dojkabacteria bacterium]|nr:glycoside hydrolase family 2 TIM barrel-domain containing protein [Candidatus Dojkabacteria bacterium]
MSRIIKNFCLNWKYKPSFKKQYISKGFDDRNFETVTLPHTNTKLPYNSFDEEAYQFISCYRKRFKVPPKSFNKRIFLHFEGIMVHSEFYLNEKRITEHKGGYRPIIIEITKFIDFSKYNILVIKVDSREKTDIPPFGGTIDYLTYGGIYREAEILFLEKTFINEIFVTPNRILTNNPSAEIKFTVDSSDPLQRTAILSMNILKDNKVIASGKKRIRTKPNSSKEFSLKILNLKNIKLWDIDDPQLYELELTLKTSDGKMLDRTTTRFGFREAKFTKKGFFLNGKRIELRGLNRHQSFPFVGYAMPKRAQEKDAEILKNELHLNITRTSHYIQSKYFLDKCDELGLLVFEEVPGWQYVGSKTWQNLVLEDLQAMIKRDYNHPSIVLWGVRINESQDCRGFYQETNRLAHKLDKTRQTGGVRCLYHNTRVFQEDVYTLNDFTFEGKNKPIADTERITGEKIHPPYLITEFCGHLYPTKKYDHEERLEEQARRHLEVLDAAGKKTKISGAIGWCAFDYNTHSYFGSGDRICYHGVMDMYRLPKFASSVYKSQVDPEAEIVLDPMTIWSTGERNIWGNARVDLYVYTNCDQVDLVIDQKKIGSFTPHKKYSGIKHPPVMIKNMHKVWRDNWGNAKFIGFINGEIRIVRDFVKNPIASNLEIKSDDKEIRSDAIDVTRVIIRILDQVRNPVLHYNEPLEINISGPGEVIGPKHLSPLGGSCAFWIKSKAKPGTIVIKINSERLGEKILKVKTRKVKSTDYI